MMLTDTPKAAGDSEAAFRAAEKRGPLNMDRTGSEEKFRRGEGSVRNNLNFPKEAAAAKTGLKERGELPDTDG